MAFSMVKGPMNLRHSLRGGGWRAKHSGAPDTAMLIGCPGIPVCRLQEGSPGMGLDLLAVGEVLDFFQVWAEGWLVPIHTLGERKAGGRAGVVGAYSTHKVAGTKRKGSGMPCIEALSLSLVSSSLSGH